MHLLRIFLYVPSLLVGLLALIGLRAGIINIVYQEVESPGKMQFIPWYWHDPVNFGIHRLVWGILLLLVAILGASRQSAIARVTIPVVGTILILIVVNVEPLIVR